MTITIRLILKMHTLHNSYSPVVITKVHTALNLAPSSKTLQNVWCQSMIITVAEFVCILQCILHSVRHSHTIKIHQNIVLWLDHCGAYSIHEATSFFFWGWGEGGSAYPAEEGRGRKRRLCDRTNSASHLRHCSACGSNNWSIYKTDMYDNVIAVHSHNSE